MIFSLMNKAKILEAIVWQEVKYILYGSDPKFFKIMGKDLYYNVGTRDRPEYGLLKVDYNEL